MADNTTKTLQQQIDELKAQNAALVAQVAAKTVITLKVGDKGGVSMYGINSRFPITLYANQWERVLGAADKVKAFIAEHKSELSVKGDKATA